MLNPESRSIARTAGWPATATKSTTGLRVLSPAGSLRWLSIGALAAVAVFSFADPASALELCVRSNYLGGDPGEPREGAPIELRRSCDPVKEVSLASTEDLAALAAMRTELADVSDTVDALEPTQIPCATQTGNDVIFEGCNVHVRNGKGGTRKVNGLGNLIVGYDEQRTPAVDYPKTGSHNLIVGSQHSYSSYAGFVVGDANTISGPGSSVSGGTNSVASGQSSSVSGGKANIASGDYSSVLGGGANEASGYESSVAGGRHNIATGDRTSISGGYDNIASGSGSSVSGGRFNEASGDWSSVSGGGSNIASGTDSSALAGTENEATGGNSSVSGGYKNIASGNFSSVLGGRRNTASGYWDIAP